MGRVWKSVRHKIDPAGGSDDDSLDALTWYDAEGQVVKVDGGSLEKYQYDRLGRRTHTFALAKDNDAAYADGSRPECCEGTPSVGAQSATPYRDNSNEAIRRVVRGAGQVLECVVRGPNSYAKFLL
jgi:hypothetical protein